MSSRSKKPRLKEHIGFPSAVLLIIGTIIGAGVFSTPGFVASLLHSPWLILVAWALGGAISLAGALSYAELGAAWPHPGGHYVYMRRAYGPFWGFVDGWAAMLINFPGSIAAMSIALAAYLGELLPGLATGRILIALPWLPDLTVGRVVAVTTIVALSTVNHAGIREGTWVQDVVTALKIVIFTAFIVMGLILIPDSAQLPSASANTLDTTPVTGLATISALGAALIAVMFTYFGWDSATYVASEVKNPQRNLPRAALLGTLVVTAIYLALNVVYLRVVPPEEMTGSIVIADVAAQALFGPTASKLVTAAIVLSILGGLNAMVLTGPRIMYAMARDGVFFKSVGEVNTQTQTPVRAIWIQAAISAVLAWSGAFEALFTAAGFVITLLAGATALAVLVLRRKLPDHPRPYRTWGAPATPILFVVAALWIGVSSIIEQPLYSLGGLLVIASAWPAYRLWLRHGSAVDA
jgi:basic amino acid/polyamine antiporter, APA family